MSFQPSDIPGLVLWIDPTDSLTYTLSGSTITSITDKASSNSFSNTIGSPLLWSNAFNTKDVMYFTNNSVLANNTLSFPNNAYSLFAVTYLSNQDGSYKRALNGIPDSTYFLGVSGSNIATFTGNGSSWNDVNANTPPYTNLHKLRIINTEVDSGGTLTPTVNTLLQDTKTGTTGSISEFQIGGSSGGQYWDGAIGDVLVYNSTLTTANKSTLTSYLATKYAIPLPGVPTAPVDLSFNVLGQGPWTFAQSASAAWYSGLSSNGQYQVVAADYTWISSNYGSSWTQSTGPSPNVNGSAISGSGQYMTGINAASGYIYTSSDYGSNWTQREGPHNFRGVSMSASGQYQTSAADNSNIWWSDDYGSNWTVVNTAAPSLWDTAVSGNGQYQLAVSVYQYVYFSSNYGQTWVQKITDTNRNWYGCAISDTGDYMTVASGDGGDIWTSTDYGATFTQQTFSNSFFGAVTMTGDGKYQMTCRNNPTSGELLLSVNYGSNWTSLGSITNSAFNIYDISLSKDGKYALATTYFNGIQTYTTKNLFWTPTSQYDSLYSVYYYNASTYTLVTSTSNTYVPFTSLVDNSSYQYAVKASNSFGMSDYSALSGFIVIGNGGAAPGPPTNFIANGTTLSWTAPTEGADFYNLYTYTNSVYTLYRSSITGTSIAYSNLYPDSNIVYALTAQKTGGNPSIYSSNTPAISVSFNDVPNNSVPGDTYTQTALENVTSPTDFAATLQNNADKFVSPVIDSGTVDISGIMNSNTLAPGYSLTNFTSTPTIMIAIADGSTVVVPSASLPASNGVLYLPAVPTNDYTLSINSIPYNFVFPSSGTSFTLNGSNISLGQLFTLDDKRYIYVGKSSAFFLGKGPITHPDPPSLSIRPRALDQQLNFFWGPPSDDGGSAVTSYTLSNATASYLSSFGTSILDTSVGDLTNGVDYTFALYATNNYGTSGPRYYRTVMPGLVPSAPQNVATTYTAGDSSAVLTWDAPVSDGGATIKWYAIFAHSSNPADPVIKKGALGTDRQRYINGLNPTSSYTFTIYAVNDPGYSESVSL